MINRPELYYHVSLERARQAGALFDDPDHSSYALSMYVAGLAVECMLRAFKMLRDPEFDEKHDIARLFKASGMLEIDRDLLRRAKRYTEEQIEEHFRELQVSAAVVCDLWMNQYRYASEDVVRGHLRRKRADRGIKGDPLRYQARILLDASQSMVDKGVFQWRLLRRSNPS